MIVSDYSRRKEHLCQVFTRQQDKDGAEELGRRLTDAARVRIGMDPKRQRPLRGRDGMP